MKYQLTHFGIKRFRSMKNVELVLTNEQAVTICGENNIGKTNVLEAMDIFFNHIYLNTCFDPDRDIPHHIQFGSGGQQQNTELSAKFIDENKSLYVVTVMFKKDESIEYRIKQDKDVITNPETIFKNIINTFKFFYVKSNNVDIPSLVSELFVTDGLIKLDNKRERQKKPLKILKEFQEQAQIALNDIQKELNQHLQDLNLLSNTNSSIKITFAEFDRLRDVVSRMTDVTIDDGNDHSISSKGSGAQRTALLTLMNYIASNATKEVIWGLDEPEVFLQPKAQKQLYKAVKKMAKVKSQTVIMTTHSQHFIDLNNLDYTHLFTCSINEKIYTRRKGKVFYEKETAPQVFSSDSVKAKAIRDHLGIEKNDGWNLLPYNVIVEGETDKKYLEAIISNTEFIAPNIIWSGSASKISAKIEFYNSLAEDLDYKPKIKVVLDNDDAGRDAFNKLSQYINKKFFKHLSLELLVLPRADGEEWNKKNVKVNWEIEDFIPYEITFSAINRTLKKAKYSIIKKKAREDKIKPANIDVQIIPYSEEAIRAENSDKQPFKINGEGQKASICLHALKLINSTDYTLNKAQISFIEKLCDDS